MNNILKAEYFITLIIPIKINKYISHTRFEVICPYVDYFWRLNIRNFKNNWRVMNLMA
jgi:hypothetical protein